MRLKGNLSDMKTKKGILKLVLILLLVAVIGVITYYATLMYQQSKPYSELDPRYNGVYELNEKDFEKIPTLKLGE